MRVRTLPFWLAISGYYDSAGYLLLCFRSGQKILKKRFRWLYAIFVRKYGFDDFNQIVFVRGTQDAGHLFYDISDVKIIDGVCVNGSGRFIRWFAQSSTPHANGLYLSLCISNGAWVLLSF